MDQAEAEFGVRRREPAPRILAQLLTSSTWSGRILGTNTTFDPQRPALAGPRQTTRAGWRSGTRTVLVRLNPNDPHPESRDQAAFGYGVMDAQDL
jgi:hypothetical protein